MEDAENTMKEDDLNKGTAPANISYPTLRTPRRRMPLMDNSSDSNIDESITCQRDTDTECQSELPATTSRQGSKFKDRRQLKKSYI